MKKLSMLVGVMAILGIMSIAVAQARPISNKTRFVDLRGSQLCMSVLTSAVNVSTGECKVFRNSCLPSGWARVISCTPVIPEVDR